MADQRRRVGQEGERLARDLLRRRGYRILETNFRCSLGELDVIARKGKTTVFVEVRTRRSREAGSPEESLTQAKKGRLRTLAEAYLQAHPELGEAWRIDVVAIELGQDGKATRAELIENAVEG